MIVGSGFDHGRMDSPPILTSSGAGTPTPTSSSNSMPQPQAPANNQSARSSGPSSWLKQQVQAFGANVLLSSGSGPASSMAPHPHLNGMSNGHPTGKQVGANQRRSLTSQAAICNENLSHEPRIRGESPDEGIQVESDV